MALSSAELAALPYTGGAPAMVAGDFKAQLFDPMGKPVRWWKAYEAPPGTPGVNAQGRLYIEQELADDVRVLFHQTTRDIVTSEFGVFPKGTSAVSNIPSDIEFARMDRILVTDVTWLARQLVKRGAGETDLLVQPHVESIAAVLVNGAAVDADSYEATETGIKWLADEVEVGSVYAVEYRYHPLFEYLMQSESLMQAGGDGAMLPQRGIVQLVPPKK